MERGVSQKERQRKSKSSMHGIVQEKFSPKTTDWEKERGCLSQVLIKQPSSIS